ncbi:ATP-binding protein [Salipaludibacillus daqingensis]|uniref:ATP-binding protein n=1 Tax=Salipaludibacillus daqingensis TaxID=3041001 RepID=UPI0024746C0A|nr:ATP-binding protein [Salipaludibacillus daqingensis]
MNTLRSFLFWKIFLINLFIIFAILGLVFFMSQTALPKLAKETYKDITDETVIRLHDQIHNITLELQELGTQIQNESLDGEIDELSDQIEKVVNYSSFVDSSTIVETDGEITGYYPSDLEEVLKNQNFADRSYVQNAIATKEIYISNIISAVTNRFVVVVAIPILNDEDEVLRVVNLIIRIGENPIFNSVIKNLQIGDAHAYIVDSEGTLISHLSPERIGENRSSNPVVQKVLDEKSGFEEVIDRRDGSMFASYKYIPTLEWGVVAQVPVSTTKVFFKTFQETLFFLSLLLFFILSVLTALYTKQIIKPIKELELAVGQVAKGNFNERITGKQINNSEIGKLSQRFNEMAEYIEGAKENIEIKEKLLMEQKEFLRKVLDTSPNFIYVKDSKGQYTLVNKSIATFYGTSVDEMLNKSEKDFNSDLVQVERHLQEDQLVMETLQEKHVDEEVLVDQNGKIKWVQTTKIPLQLVESNDVHILCVSNDITERKLVEETIRKSDKLTVVGELAAGVAHEIRNPLTSIQGFLQFLKPNYKDERYFDIMLSEIERIKLIINEMLVLSKPQAKNPEMKDVREICQMIIDLLESQANLNNIEILTEFDSNIPDIWCETNQLKQVFVNVLKNAMESMIDGGQIVVQIKKNDEETILIRFIDEGIGIEQKRIERLGEPFYSTKEKGTGLGLMVSYRIIEQHNGKIKFSSKKNQGTTVDIILPINNK